MNESVRKELVAQALGAVARAYAPYSHFQVGAAVLAASGRIYTGANVENASYGATICAERAAILGAVNAGERRMLALAVCGGRDGVVTDFCPPCGICRQVMREFCEPGAFEVLVVRSAEAVRRFTLDELLPESFGPAALRREGEETAEPCPPVR